MYSSRMRTARTLTVSRRILCMPLPQPCMPPPGNHACPPATMHAPQPTMHTPHKPCMPLPTTHPQQPCTPPGNHACPPPTTHAPNQPCNPPTPPGQPCMSPHQPCMPPKHARPPVDRMTHTCKNITFPQTSFAGGNKTLQSAERLHCQDTYGD